MANLTNKNRMVNASDPGLMGRHLFSIYGHPLGKVYSLFFANLSCPVSFDRLGDRRTVAASRSKANPANRRRIVGGSLLLE